MFFLKLHHFFIRVTSRKIHSHLSYKYVFSHELTSIYIKKKNYTNDLQHQERLRLGRRGLHDCKNVKTIYIKTIVDEQFKLVA